MRRLLLALLLLPVPALAEEAKPTTLTIVAEGHSDRAPDIADLSGGVVTQAATAAAALAANATKMTQVVAAVRRAGVAERDIQTSGLSLQPQYKYGDNHPPILTGYQVSNTVAIRVRKLAELGALVDALVAAGANQINGPTFRVDDADGALDAARTAAVIAARARAQLYAAAAGMHLGRIRSISEGTPARVEPINEIVVSAARKFAAATPVAPGEVTLGATVTMVFELD